MKTSFIDFQPLVYDFFEYMGRDKKPSNDRMSLWYSKVKNFEHKDIIEAFDTMKESIDSLPNNIPKAIKTAVFQNSRSKPDEKNEFKQHRFGKCDDCGGTGIFKFRIKIDKIMYEPVQFCSRCDNYKQWTNSPGERVSKYELDKIGVLYKPYNKCLKYSDYSGSTGNIKDIESMAKDFGERKRMK